jgi:hypothetical protein
LEFERLILDALRFAASFLGLAWRRAWLAMILTAAAAGQSLAATGHPDALLWRTLTAAGVLVASGALWRLGLDRSGAGPGGLQAGRVELRLIAVTALSVLFMMVLATLAFIVLIAFAYAAAASGHGFVASDIATWAPAVDGRGQVVVTAVAAVCLMALVWALARISLAAPATVVREQVQVLASWPITRGQSLRLLAASLIVSVVPGLLIIAPLAASGIHAAPSLAARSVAALAFSGVWLPAMIGLMAYFYRRLDPGHTANACA